MLQLFNNPGLLRRKRLTYLLVGLFLAGTVLLATHLLSVQITSSIRAYVAGESEYSKAQKDAARHLMLYTLNGNPEHYAQFRQELEVYRADSLARVTLLKGGDHDLIVQGFRGGNNHPEDVDDLIWLLKYFHSTDFMQYAIRLWEQGDGLVAELAALGREVRNARRNEQLSSDTERQYLLHIEQLTQKITEKEREFSAHLNSAARWVSRTLLLTNILIILLIAAGVTILVSKALSTLEASRSYLREQNAQLSSANKKLDSFLYAASHDLKSPIHNIQGLIAILLAETKSADATERDLLEKLKTAAQNLNASVTDIQDLLRKDHSGENDARLLDMEALLNQILEENEMSFLVSDGEINWNFELPQIHYSAMAMKSILFNLVSNAVKYQSPGRKLQLHIRTYRDAGQPVLEISDNGLGIDLEKHGDELFGIFKRFHRHDTGTGLGLYAVKGIVEHFGGSIRVDSHVDEGTTFRIRFRNESTS